MSSFLVIVLLTAMMAACSTVAPATQAPSLPVATFAPTTSAPKPTLEPATRKAPPAFPRCDGMQLLTNAVQFDWPNLEQHRQDFFRSQWTYYSCDEAARSVASLYRRNLPEAPYSIGETNWLERQEGALGVYFSQTGAWDYIWFIPQPDDGQKSYVIIAESFAYVEC